MNYRWPGESIEVGDFVAKVDFDPDTGAPHAVFIMDRGGKIGQELDEQLYELSTRISRVMQGKP
jgi:hypothetical protein